ncbi:MAG: hypothetical protein CGU28_03400 [Candidatus Dactylopiibacterium carminicum]|nr:MAG: hypothetical protein CGU28_03400 [Candidatus Dactylopiibacterium carminicum]
MSVSRPLPLLLRLLAALGLSAATLMAQAQPSGLLLFKGHGEGLSLKREEPGFRLRFTQEPATASTPAALPAEVPLQSLSAEWALPMQGFYGSTGLSWTGKRNLADNGSISSSHFALGWQGSFLPSSNWSFSAGVGTALSAGSKCAGIGQACQTPGSLGLNPEARGSGLHLNPYVSFGATYRFGN